MLFHKFQIFGVMSLSMVLISTLTFILQTIPELQENGEYPIAYKLLQVMDISAMVFFIFEYFIRLLCCPKKIAFLTRFSIYKRKFSCCITSCLVMAKQTCTCTFSNILQTYKTKNIQKRK